MRNTAGALGTLCQVHAAYNAAMMLLRPRTQAPTPDLEVGSAVTARTESAPTDSALAITMP
jgi:hypothetical protein